MPFADVGRHRLHWERVGRDDAPPLLLVMGTAFSSRAWDTLPGRLAERFRVITYDNRGVGRSTRTRAFFAMRDLADDAVAVLDAAGVARAHVFGVSLGGMVALDLALRRPDRVGALVVGCAMAGYTRGPKPGLAATRLLLRAAIGLRPSLDETARLLVSDACLRDERPRFAAWLAQVERGAPRTVLRQLLAAARFGAHDRLSSVRAPTLVVTGDADRLVPPASSRAIAAAIPGARLVELDGAGHCFPFERTDETVRLVSAHCDAHPL